MYISENDIKFAKQTISDFVNGQMYSAKTVATQISMDHPYIQHQFFKICYEYIRIMAMKHEHGQYDPRNEWACETAYAMLDNAKYPDLETLSFEWNNYEDLKRQIYYKS